MRIVDESNKPESSGLTPPPSKWKRLQKQLQSETGRTIVWGFITLFALTLVMSLDHLSLIQVVENDISNHDVFAPYDLKVEDKAETDRRRNDAKMSVLPIYQDKAPIEQRVAKRLHQFFDQLETLSQDNAQSTLEKNEAFLVLVKRKSGSSALKSMVFEPASHGQWQRLQLYSEQTINQVLKKGLSQSAFDETLSDRIKTALQEALPESHLNSAEKEALVDVVSVVIEPNLLIDASATRKAQELAAIKVKPNYHIFRKGEKIISRGEPLNDLKENALAALGKTHQGFNWLATIGVFSLGLMYISVLWGYNYYFESGQFFKPKYAALLATLTIGTLVAFMLFEKNNWPLIALPFSAYPLILSIFTHPRVGVLAGTLMMFLVGLVWQIPISVLSVLLFGSVVGVFVLSQRIHFNDRSQVMVSGVTIGVTNALILLTVTLLTAAPNTNVWQDLGASIMCTALISGLGSGIVTFGILPYLESMFRLITPFTLMEMGNHDKPLLRRMQFEAPGTFHHSLMVATLSEAAAQAIGANALLARVGSLYHDIGKMKRPLFFIENQAYFGVENPHDKLTPRLSKMVVTAHPRDSLEMAKQYKLPEVITKFMTEHHGTLVAGYFYNQACLQEGTENVNKAQFRYPGPKPNIRETAICMLADACESAVRALKNPTPTQIEERIDKIIAQRVDDGQFSNCPLTFKDLSIIRETFIRVIRGIQHNRIEYQQNVMQELGRKMPKPLLPETTTVNPPPQTPEAKAVGEVSLTDSSTASSIAPTPLSQATDHPLPDEPDYHATEY